MTQNVIVVVPGHGEVEFPPGMSEADMEKAIRKNFMLPPKKKSTPKMEESPSFTGRLKDTAAAGMKGLIAGGPMGGMTGMLGEGMSQLEQASEKAAYKVGETVTDSLAGTVSPEVAAGAGFAANVGTQAIPAVLGGGLVKQAAPMMKSGAKWLMQSALKPTYADIKTGKAAKAIDTLLKEGINPTMGGVDKLKGMVDDLGDEIQSALDGSSATIKKSDVGKRLQETFEKFKEQVNPESDLAAIKKAWTEFRNHPMLLGKTEMPVQTAQKIKQGTYTQLAKKYGQLGTADTEAQKALARGLKEEISAAVPQVAPLNAKQSELLNALTVGERRAIMDMNKNPAGLSLLANNPVTWAAFMADKSALFKSLVARMMHSGSGAIPTAGGAATGGLYGMEQGLPPEMSLGNLYK